MYIYFKLTFSGLSTKTSTCRTGRYFHGAIQFCVEADGPRRLVGLQEKPIWSKLARIPQKSCPTSHIPLVMRQFGATKCLGPQLFFALPDSFVQPYHAGAGGLCSLGVIALCGFRGRDRVRGLS